MSEERVIRGQPASTGLAEGIAFLPGVLAITRQAGSPAAEAGALREAMAKATRQLSDLMERSDSLASEILEFQVALLDDEVLTSQVFDGIAAGQPAHTAWAKVLDTEIADYAGGANDYLAARASDLADLRDRVLRALGGDAAAAEVPAGAVLVAPDLTPSAFLEQDWTRLKGAALGSGSPTSHVAILARARGVPMAVGLALPADLATGMTVLLDGEAGTLTLAPSGSAQAAFAERRSGAAVEAEAAGAAASRPAATRSGKPVAVMINVDDPSLLKGLDPAICDGIGLVRTEFLFEHGAPDEDAQTEAYARIVRWADGRPVTIRTLDAGGDKPVPGLSMPHEDNPFLGIRGLRLSLRHPEVFRTQLRAICRAAVSGAVKLMLPMVTVPAEFAEAAAHLDEAVAELARRELPHARPDLGIMVETPAAALTARSFPAAFYSIGSNDLIQYVTAAARDNAALAPLADPRNPAVLELISRTVEAGRVRGAEVSLCGDMASDPALVAVLMELGLDRLSVAPAQAGRVKLAIGAVP